MKNKHHVPILSLGLTLFTTACVVKEVVYQPVGGVPNAVTANPVGPTTNTTPSTVKTVTITGIVTADGFKTTAGGLADARVALENTPYATKTDAQGRFELKDVPADKAQSLVAKKTEPSGQQFAVRQPVPKPTSAQLNLASLALTQTGSIFGQIKATGESDLLGLDVFVEGTSMAAKTDKDGNFALTNVPAGTYTVTALKAGFKAANKSVTVTSGKPSQVSIELTNRLTTQEATRFGMVVGTVLSSKGPVAGATVSIPGESYTSVTNKDGKFRLTNVLPNAKYPFLVVREGFEPQELEIAVKAGETTTQDVNLSAKRDEPNGNIKGTLKGKDGQPLPNTDVETEPATKPTKTDSQGNFEIPDTLPGSYYVKGVKDGQVQASQVFGLDAGQSVQLTVNGVFIDNSVNTLNVNCGTTTNINSNSISVKSTNQVNCGSTNVSNLSPTIIINR